MSESNSSVFKKGSERIYIDKYQTDFMRVSQRDENELEQTRHPGSPTVPQQMSNVPPSSPGYTGAAVSASMNTSVYTSVTTVAAPAAGEDVLCCPVCKVDYDSVLKRPILLPGCGHTFCSVCVRERAMVCLECPVCRRQYPGATVEALPVNLTLESLLVSKHGAATLQRIIMEYSGENGGAVAGGKCGEHGQRLVFWCRGCEVAACGECLFDTHPSDTHTLAKLADVAAEIKDTAMSTVTICHEDATKIFSIYLKKFVWLVENINEAGKLMQNSKKLSAAVNCATDFTDVCSVYNEIKKLNSRVVELKLDTGASEETPPETISRVGGGRTAVHAMHSDGRLARVQVEEFGMHVYALEQHKSSAYSVAIRLGQLLEFVQREEPVVFLDLTAGEQWLGRVYLKLRGDMRRSVQFVHLCLGTLGHSYRGSKVDGISDSGAPGEYLRLGDYTGQGGQGGLALIDGLEWGSKWCEEKRSGQVCGVGGDAGEQRFGALFVVCLRDNPDDVFRCPFGAVLRGMDVLHRVALMEPLNEVFVSDCGVLISIQ